MDIAREMLKKYDAVFDSLPAKGKGNLRFGRSLISISSIATQYYCEQKLELQNQYPMPPTKIMQDGETAHESVTALAAPVTREESVRVAVKEREKPICIYEFGIAWEYKGVPIIGKVDEAWFRGGNVDLVVERKFSNRLEIYSPYHVQAQLYCLGLGEMGFNASSTRYKIMVFKRNCFDCPELMSRSCAILALDTSHFRCEVGEAKAFVYPFNETRIIGDLDWALDYWLSKREAIPTRNAAKCRACEYSKLCKSSSVA